MFGANIVAFLGFAASAYAWGNLGHETVGLVGSISALADHTLNYPHYRFVAQAFLAPNALSFVQNTLGTEWNFSLGPAAIVSCRIRVLRKGC